MDLLDMPTSVYRCYDDQGHLLYVGMSVDPVKRIASHRRYAVWLPRMARWTTEWFPDRATARAEELRAMREESSAHNQEGLTMPALGLASRDHTRWALEAVRLRRSGWAIRAIADAVGTSRGRVTTVLKLHHLAGAGWRRRRPMW